MKHSPQARNFEFLIVFLSFFFNLNSPNNFFAETFLLDGESRLLPLVFWVNEWESGLGGEDIFHNFPESKMIPSPILPTRENPGWRSFLRKLLMQNMKRFKNIEVIRILTCNGYVSGFFIAGWGDMWGSTSSIL